MDRYPNFSELSRSETPGEDYTILYRETRSGFAIMAPHGGGIEPGTIDIAEAVAADDHSFYAFKGLKKTGNQALHITSNRFDEPTALRVARNASVVISVHGCRDGAEIVYVGGRHVGLKEKMVRALKAAGFEAVISEVPGLRGTSPDNICNRCAGGQGVQLEISRGLREKLFANLERRPVRSKTGLFYIFTRAIRAPLRG
jgi:phage replication-related protein YjqB (UPF0714/DUF867 family)